MSEPIRVKIHSGNVASVLKQKIFGLRQLIGNDFFNSIFIELCGAFLWSFLNSVIINIIKLFIKQQNKIMTKIEEFKIGAFVVATAFE